MPIAILILLWLPLPEARANDPLSCSKNEKLLSRCARDILAAIPHSFEDWVQAQAPATEKFYVIRQGKTLSQKGIVNLLDGDVIEGDGNLSLRSRQHVLHFRGPFKVQVEIKKAGPEPLINLTQIKGFLLWKVKGCTEVPCEKLELKTPTAPIGIRGTVFISSVLPKVETFKLYEGEISVKRGTTEVVLRAPEKLIWPLGGEPQRSPLEPSDHSQLRDWPLQN